MTCQLFQEGLAETGTLTLQGIIVLLARHSLGASKDLEAIVEKKTSDVESDRPGLESRLCGILAV